jgi:hypothetical protein
MNDELAILQDPEFQEALEKYLEAVRLAKGKKRVQPILRRLEMSLRKAFRTQGRLFFRKLQAQVRGSLAESVMLVKLHEADPEPDDPEPVEPKKISEEDFWKIWFATTVATLALFSGPIDHAVSRALAAGASQTIADLGVEISFPAFKNPRAFEYLRDYGAKLVKGINEETRSELKNILLQSVDYGWSWDKTTKAIADKFEQFSYDRARLVSVTEIGNAYSEGNLLAAQELADAGLQVEKSWSTVGDDKVSELCKGNEEAGWIPLDQDFPSGHQRPLGHPGCRCDLMTRTVTREE